MKIVALPLVAVLAIAIAPSAVHACRAAPGSDTAPFVAALTSAEHVVVVRVESQALAEYSKQDRSSRAVVAEVRIVEVLVGKRPTLQRISYYSTWCGGHRLDVGGYYVILMPHDLPALSVPIEGQLVAGLGDEYSELVGDDGDSTLLMYLRNFAKGAPLPSAFNLEPYLNLARMPHQVPSVEAR
jgi:hypothetical protein